MVLHPAFPIASLRWLSLQAPHLLLPSWCLPPHPIRPAQVDELEEERVRAEEERRKAELEEKRHKLDEEAAKQVGLC
jgi:hypothetical protein